MANQDQADYWNRRSISWDEEATKAEPVIGPFGQMAMEALRLRVGERVLDIGCGTGVTTRMLADALHPSGHAHGVDISSAMIDIARERVFHGGASFEVADAQVAAVEGAPFDAAFSRFGVMFFADPAAAFANLATALDPGGRVAFVCWQAQPLNEWVAVPALAMLPIVGPPEMPPPDAPGPFAFADQTRVEGLLAGAGFTDVVCEALTPSILLGGGLSLDDTVAWLAEGGMGKRFLAGADGPTADRALAAVREALGPFVTPDGVRMATAVWLVSATRT